jgi:hypothetical protein
VPIAHCLKCKCLSLLLSDVQKNISVSTGAPEFQSVIFTSDIKVCK